MESTIDHRTLQFKQFQKLNRRRSAPLLQQNQNHQNLQRHHRHRQQPFPFPYPPRNVAPTPSNDSTSTSSSTSTISEQQHAHEHAQEHEQQREYEQEHDHEHEREHKLDHDHEHKPELDHEHEHSHDHEHEHDHEHDHEHTHEHEHEHEYEHEHEVIHELSHELEHGQERKHEFEHDHNEEQGSETPSVSVSASLSASASTSILNSYHISSLTNNNNSQQQQYEDSNYPHSISNTSNYQHQHSTQQYYHPFTYHRHQQQFYHQPFNLSNPSLITSISTIDNNLSSYKITNDEILINHSNELGIRKLTGYDYEKLRFRRFRAIYISKSMNEIAKKEFNSLNAKIFRNFIVTSEFLTLCRRKKCFHKEFLPPRPNSNISVPDEYDIENRNFKKKSKSSSKYVKYYSNSNQPNSYSQSQLQQLQQQQMKLRHLNFIKYNFQNSFQSYQFAHKRYGESIINDINLGFSRTFNINENILYSSAIPTIKDSKYITTSTPTPTTHQSSLLLSPNNILSVVIASSYDTEHEQYQQPNDENEKILDISFEQWKSIVYLLRSLCEKTNASGFRIWTNKLFQFKPINKKHNILRWITSYVVPFAIFPVIYIPNAHITDTENMQNMWLSVQCLTASFGQGLILASDLSNYHLDNNNNCHSNHNGHKDMFPDTWPSKYRKIVGSRSFITTNRKKSVRKKSRRRSSMSHEGNDEDDENDEMVTGVWFSSNQMDVVHVVKRLTGIIMCGYVRNKKYKSAEEAQGIVEWASILTSTLTYGSIGHLYSCQDCSNPMGYLNEIRIITLISTCTPITLTNKMKINSINEKDKEIPELDEEQEGNVYMKINVPKIEFEMNDKSWDGVREWLPESSLWGSLEDNLQNDDRIRQSFHQHSRGILICEHSKVIRNSIAILQFAVVDNQLVNRRYVGYLLIYISHVNNQKYYGKVEWSKRFWPTGQNTHRKMWSLFDIICKDSFSNNNQKNALNSLIQIVSQSTNLDFDLDVETSDIKACKIDISKIRWS